MKFTALPVKRGDSFLLHSPSGTILVDAGHNKKHILELLKKEHINSRHINLIVCTHYDADHINGILGILESQDYTFGEIWLPEILGSLSYTLSEDLISILRRLREIDSVNRLTRNAPGSNTIEEDTRIPEDSPIRLASLDNMLQARYCPFAFEDAVLRHESSSTIPIQAMHTNMRAALGIVHSALSSGACVRWFKYTNALTNIEYGFGMIALNSTETGLTRYSPDVFLCRLYLTTKNVESLVFKFSCDQHPDILFCADSDLSFTRTPINLKNDSVVTAPHHGSDSCNNAYNLINGSNLIYVRSDQSQRKRPGSGYLNQQDRYCTICRNRGPQQKVEISYTGSTPTVIGQKCMC
jgi:hypothetical protein